MLLVLYHSLIHIRIAFGDSYTYVQGTKGYPGFSFIGSYLPSQFAITAHELWHDQIVQNFSGTAEGGPNWVEFLTGCGLQPGLTSPKSCEIQLWDFAFAGADVSEKFTPLHHNWTIPLVNQTQRFLSWVQPEFQKKNAISQKDTLLALWIGINDIGDVSRLSNVSFPSLYESIVSTIFNESVQPLFDGGYRDLLLINLPPLDRTPGNVGSSNPLPNKTMIGWWNDALSHYSRDFVSRHQDMNIMNYDANSFLNFVLENPEAYDIRNTTGYCPGYTDPDVMVDPGKYGCLPIDQYFWFNTGHLTSHIHHILSQDIGKFLRQQRSNKGTSGKLYKFPGL
ncbi:hypothetical protein BGW36DRAFT_463152 [Talaromyces proteolyticus]|uniref:Lysophospholipase A n=1 Tax=Talaromyces proteolyticus TaxID=1131652 RepID=A0AAD4KMZ6_9EURO|nr:uncharacterized protein BGW36DRAFT_463152 [Talaromyces proteolyticus]KAH8695595.1 hypothetical protein BGW36DRAFT_463152 [Talaromyces proteolyticus]